MDLSNTEIKIVVKNMAREMVKRATAKNAKDMKDEVRALLVKWGNNPADVDKLLAKNYEWAASRYDSVRTIAEAVRTVNATTKNATQFKYGDKVTVDGKYEGVVQAVKDGYYEVRIFDGSRVVGSRVCWPKDVTARNATAKNAPRLRGIYKDKNEAQARVDRENAKKENANEIHTIEKVGDEFHVVADKK